MVFSKTRTVMVRPLVLFEDVITSAEPGDLRIARKTRKRTTARSSGKHRVEL